MVIINPKPAIISYVLDFPNKYMKYLRVSVTAILVLKKNIGVLYLCGLCFVGFSCL